MDEEAKIRNTENGVEVPCIIHERTENEITMIVAPRTNHAKKVVMKPNRMNTAYVGTVMGREMVYERSVEQVKADIDRLNPRLKQSRPR